MRFSFIYFISFLLCLKNEVNGQEVHPNKLLISSIEIKGIKKTKEYIVIREMTLKKGDSVLPELLQQEIKNSRHLIYNTNLFSVVKIDSSVDASQNIKLTVSLIERWYIYPAPQFKLIDRNINEWWKIHNADIDRITYGVKFDHFNVSGRADQLNLMLLNGYTRNFSINYYAPYSNRSLTEGFSIGVNFSQSREFSYKTSSQNKLLRYQTDDFERTYLSLSASYRVRKGFYKSHVFYSSIQKIIIPDTILSQAFNPEYFGSSRTTTQFIDLSYVFQFTNVNNINYPLRGTMYKINLYKRGLEITGGLNMFSFDIVYKKFLSHPHHFYTSFQLFSKIKLPFDQPYINQKAMGYGNYYLRGLEYYVVDGPASGLTQFTLSKKIASFKIPVPLKNRWVPYIPFNIYGKSFADAGYAYSLKNYTTMLNNKLLYTAGFGLDILSLYDLRLSIECSYNQLGEKGLFLHTQTAL